LKLHSGSGNDSGSGEGMPADDPASKPGTRSGERAAPVSRARRRVAIGAAGTTVLIGSIDAYVLVSVLVDMISDLGIPANHLERATPLVTGYLLGYVAGMPLLGRLSDRFGRRIVIHVCLAGFAIGSVISATAADLAPLIAGRALQGLAGGALLPVTMALAADLFAARRRAAVLGWGGAAQELGAVIGPLFGAGVALLLGWRGIFWINIPLALIAALAIHLALPAGRDRARTQRVDVFGGVLLAVALGLLVIGLYNPEPEAGVLPPWGPTAIGLGLASMVAFGLWQWRSPVRLLEPEGVRWRPFAAALAASLCTGGALMVTLVDIQLMAQTLLGMSATEGSLLLVRFLIGLPIGAILGGRLVPVLGERTLTAAGMLAAGAAYLLVSRWPLDAANAVYELGPVTVPRMDADLVLAGLALGLVIAPLSTSVLRATPDSQHGIASASVVVARMMGMLLGVAALTAWSLHRFRTSTADLDTPLPFGVTETEYREQFEVYRAALDAALHAQYSDVFAATAVICLAGAVCALGLDGRAARTGTSAFDRTRTY
jgi:MFS family permease